MNFIISKIENALRADKSFAVGENGELEDFVQGFLAKEDDGIRELLAKLKSSNSKAFSELETFLKERFFRECDFPTEPLQRWRKDMDHFREALKQLCKPCEKLSCIIVHGEPGLCKASAVAEQLYDDCFLAGCCPNAIGCTWLNVNDRQETWFETEIFIQHLCSFNKLLPPNNDNDDGLCQLVLLDGFPVRHLNFLLSHPSLPRSFRVIIICRKFLAVEPKLYGVISVVQIQLFKEDDLFSQLIKRHELLSDPLKKQIVSYCNQRPYFFFLLQQILGSSPEIAKWLAKNSGQDNNASTPKLILKLLESNDCHKHIALLLFFREYENINSKEWQSLLAKLGLKNSPSFSQLRQSVKGESLACNRLLLEAAKSSDYLIKLACFFFKKKLFPHGFPQNSVDEDQKTFARYRENLLLNVGVKAISIAKTDWSLDAFFVACQNGGRQFYEGLVVNSSKVERSAIVNGIEIACANLNVEIVKSLLQKLQESQKQSSVLPFRRLSYSDDNIALDQVFLDCAEKGSWPVVCVLAEHATVSVISKRSRALAMKIAHRKNYMPVVKLLLQKGGADLNEPFDLGGKGGLLEYAIQCEDQRLIEAIAEDVQKINVREAFTLALERDKDEAAWCFFQSPNFKSSSEKSLQAISEAIKMGKEELAIKCLKNCTTMTRDAKAFYDAFELAVAKDMSQLVASFRSLQPPADINHLRNNGQTLLMRAIDNCNEKLASGLIKLGCDIFAKDSNGRTALHYAAAQATSDDIALQLVKAGADPFQLDSKSESAFHIAVEGYNTGVWEVLAQHFQHDSRINAEIFPLLYIAANTAERQRLIKYLDLTWVDVSSKENVLIKAVRTGAREAYNLIDVNTEVFAMVMDEVAKMEKNDGLLILNCEDASQRTALHYACALGRLHFAEALLKAGAVIKEDGEKKSPVLLAIENNPRNCADVVSLLLRSCKTEVASRLANNEDSLGNTPLLKALTVENWQAISFLLQHGARPDMPSEPFEKSAIAKAIQMGSDEAATFMIDRISDKVTLENVLRLIASEGNIQLLRHLSQVRRNLLVDASILTLLLLKSQSYSKAEECERYDKELAEFLKEGHLDGLLEHRTVDGKTPLQLATEHCLERTALLLYSKSSLALKIEAIKLNAGQRGSCALLPYFLSKEQKEIEVVHVALDHLITRDDASIVLDCIITHPLASTFNWQDIAWQAVRDGNAQAAEQVLKRGKADPRLLMLKICESCTQEGVIGKLISLKKLVNQPHPPLMQTALMVAALHDNENVARDLLNLGAKTDAVDSNGRTALILAAEKNATKVGALLIKTQGCDLMKTDDSGNNALTKAASCNNAAFIGLLLSVMGAKNSTKAIVGDVFREGVRDNRLVVVQEILQHSSKYGIFSLRYLQTSVLQGNAEMTEILLKMSTHPILPQARGQETLLMTAARKANPQILQLLLQYKCCSVEEATAKGTALHYAVEAGQVENALILLESQVPIDQRDENGKTALLLAIEHNNLEIVRLLGQFNADPNISDSTKSLPVMTAFWLEQVDILDEVLKLQPLIKIDRVGLATKLISKDIDPKYLERFVTKLRGDVNAITENGDPMLILATRNRLLNHIRTLLALKADVNMTNSSGDSAVTVATELGYVDVLEWFIKSGANVNARHLKQKMRRPLLVLAAECNQAKIVQLLLLSAAVIKVDAADDSGETALMKAIKNGSKEIVQLLISAKADLRQRNREGQSIISLAIASKQWQVLEILITACKSQSQDNDNPLYAGDANGYPFFIATLLSEQKDLDSILKLKSIDKDVINSKQIVNGLPIGPSALMVSVQNKLSQSTRLLLAYGADVNYMDCFGKTAMIEAAHRGDYYTLVKLAEKSANPLMFKQLSEGIAEQTVLTAAVQACSYEVTRFLLNMKTFHLVNLKNRHGETPLHIAIRKDALDIIVDLLISNGGADLEVRNAAGLTPLMLASCSHKPNAALIVARLLEHHANVNARSAVNGLTVLMVAISYFYKKLFIEDEEGKVTNLAVSEDETIRPPIEALLSDLVSDLDVNAKVEGSQTTALMLVASLKNARLSHALAQRLIQKGADVNASDSRGVTALMIAAEAGNVDLVILLVRSGADTSMTDANGRDARQYAEEAKRDNLKILLPSNSHSKRRSSCDIL